MLLLTDISFFTGERNIPNTDSPEVASSVNLFIQKYEPKILKDALGYELYSALQAALSSNSTATQWQHLIFGTDYTNNYSRLDHWRGLIDTDSTVYSFANGTAGYKPPEWITVGETLDTDNNIIIPANASSFTISGAAGWIPIIDRRGVGPIEKNVDYTWDAGTATVTLLQAGDMLQDKEKLFIEYELKYTEPTEAPQFTYKRSFIADYIYWWWMGANASFTTGIGEKVATSGNAIDVNPSQKMVNAWNDLSEWLGELWAYLDKSRDTYTEWYGTDWNMQKRYRKTNVLGI